MVVDDDPSIIATWREKINDMAPGVVLREFSSYAEIEPAFDELERGGRPFYVLDQYAGQGPDGLTGVKFIEITRWERVRSSRLPSLTIRRFKIG